MPHVTFVHPFLLRLPRGIERYVVSLGSALARAGAEVDVLTWAAENPIGWPELDPRVRVRTLPTPRYYEALGAAPFLAAALARGCYDAAFIHFADYGEAGALGLLRALRREPPFSIVLHFPYSEVPHRYRTLVESGLAARARHVIAVSQFVAREAEPVLGRRCEVIPHGVNTDHFRADPAVRAAVRRELGVSADAPLLLTVAALEERKGVQHLLQALPGIATKLPDIVYAIVGDGHYRPQIEHLVDELGLRSRVRLLGARTDAVRFFQAADIAVILARGEASSLTSLEAMACGLPVVASTHPPFDELIAPAWGRQVDEADAAAVAETVVELLNDTRLRAKMGEAARARVLAEHDWDHIAERYLSLIR